MGDLMPKSKFLITIKNEEEDIDVFSKIKELGNEYLSLVEESKALDSEITNFLEALKND